MQAGGKKKKKNIFSQSTWYITKIAKLKMLVETIYEAEVHLHPLTAKKENAIGMWQMWKNPITKERR